MPGIGVVTNPRSRRNRRDPRLAENLAYILGERGQLEAPSDLPSLDRAMAHFKRREVEILAINGGDGTSHVVLSSMLRVWGDAPLPQVALLRGGTMNTIAAGLGIRGTPDDLLGRVVAAYHDGRPLRTTQRHVLMVDGNAGFLFGNGLLSQFLEVYYERADPTPTWAAMLLARAIASVVIQGPLIKRITRPVQARVTLGSVTWEPSRWLAVAAGTVDDLGLGFRPFFKSLEYPGYMHAVGASGSAMSVVGQLLRIRGARQIQHPDILDGVADRLVIEADEPLNYMLDGDFHQGGTRLEVVVGPRIELVLP